MTKRQRLCAWVLFAMLLLTACGRDDTAQQQAPTAESKPEITQPAGKTVRVIELTLSFVEPRFRPDPVVVQVGTPIQFKLSSADTRHTLVIEALGIDIDVPQKALGKSVLTRVVTPQKAGTYRMFCRIHARLPMEGTLIVSETAAQ